MESNEHLGWVNFYMELADKLLPYKKDRKTLIEKIKKIFNDINKNVPKIEPDNTIIDIDPFTLFGFFNKQITNSNKIAILQGFASELSINTPVPTSFKGVPELNNQNANFFRFNGERGENDIENLWAVFAAALKYSNNRSDINKQEFINAYDIALKQKGVRWNITMALYWIRPYEYISLDGNTREYITNPKNVPINLIEKIGKLKNAPSGKEYLSLNDLIHLILEKESCSYKNFPEISYLAWESSQKEKKESAEAINENTRVNVGEAIGDKDISSVHYWIYSPGNNADMWETFYNKGVMAIGWGKIGNLSAFSNKDEMKEKMKECIDPTLSYKNSAHATWQFVHDMKPGDIVFVKKGMHRIVGKGTVMSDYIFNDAFDDNYKNFRKMKWTHNGDWEHPGQAVTKTLTDITSYTDYVEKLNELFDDDLDEEREEVEIQYPEYTENDFLNEVYINEENYYQLMNLLENKKNIILQGAPGVGKTFAAKRLAYSKIGVKDPNRVMMVQFHQSYSYEDFIIGFRPSSTGFELKKGPFYTFCKKAEQDLENDYFFIIDEINRGNLSKIFGELFMLIEKDKRGASLQLLYSDEQFSVPKNVYIIGMMNTADRSLAILDYALRRRFAFFEFLPAFETEGFIKYRQNKNSYKFDNLIETIKQLNTAIENDESLGHGFCIGHSYFCTEKEISDEWLESVINYEIIPLLNEYWFDDPSKVKAWANKLKEAIR